MPRLTKLPCLRARDYNCEIFNLFSGANLRFFGAEEEVFDCEEGAADVGIVGFLPEGEGDLPDWVGVGFICYASVGDEDVDGSMLGFGLGDAGLD